MHQSSSSSPAVIQNQHPSVDRLANLHFQIIKPFVCSVRNLHQKVNRFFEEVPAAVSALFTEEDTWSHRSRVCGDDIDN